MGQLQTNGYITCSSCNTVNKLHEIGEQGLYHCGTCKNPLIFINKEKPKPGLLKTLIIAGMIGIAGGVSINQIKDALRPTEINYSKIQTNWTGTQVRQFDFNCKANLALEKKKWDAERIDKTCTCFTTYVVENTKYPLWGKLDTEVVEAGIKECT
ncbi:hypothetical protein NI462_11235 [Acinetobacter lwoffii]|uniref:hypothetical protein n=1 Tax=Acinetobacter lwoffii TaxID=28090 RepID=UPI00209AA957|nr:hypothetical protein [Acinetobacter lwoffii]MCO8097740.1 hypothetical protein [Acinetobacter lwoffii]